MRAEEAKFAIKFAYPYGQNTRRIRHAQRGVDVDGIRASGGPLLSAGSAIARTYNPTSEQKLAHHTEDIRHEDQLPPATNSARTTPSPHAPRFVPAGYR